MWNKTITLVAACLMMWASAVNAVELTAEQQAAKDRGIAIFNQYRVSGPELRIAAEAGDAEAQFYLGEELRQLSRFITPESQKWLEAAANQGHTYAMIRLSRSGANLCAVADNCPQGSKTPRQWFRQVYDLLLPLAEQGDPEAMFQMYKATGDTQWRTRAAEAGHAEAQYWHALFITEGFGSYWWPGSRQEAVEKWYKASAEGGYPVGMEQYAGVLLDKNELADYRYWIEKAARTGHASSIYSYGSIYFDLYKEQGNEDDLIKAYGLISLLLELDGGGSPNKDAAEWKLAQIAEETQITPDQIEQAQAFTDQWKANHPAPSFFPHIIDAMDY